MPRRPGAQRSLLIAAQGIPMLPVPRPVLPTAVTALLACVAVGLGACAGDGAPPLVAAGRVYRHSMDQAPTSLDPTQSANVYANHVVLNTYDTLYAYRYLARPYRLKPNLAVDFPEISADGLRYRIRIKPGVMFIDDPCFPEGRGREVFAEDFVYSIKRQFDPENQPQGAWFWQGRIVGIDEWKQAGSDYDQPVAGLRATDRYTIDVQLTRPYPQLVDTFAQGYAAIVPREAAEYYGKRLGVHPVGSGPFRLVSYDTSRVVMDRNPVFRKEPVDVWAEGYDPDTQSESGVIAIHGRAPPFVDRIEINFITEGSSAWSSFTKGDEIQYTSLPIEQVDRALASKDPITLKPEYAEKYHVYSGVEAGFVFTSFNMDFPEFGYNADPERERRNTALRCALIKAYDWQARNESWYFGLGRIFPGIIVPASPEFDAGLPMDSVTRDVEGARRLLRDNGWTAENLPTLIYGTAAGVTDRLFFEQLRAWYVEIGYPREKLVHRTYANFGNMSRAWKRGELPLVAKGWGLDYPDAENTLQLFYGPNGSPGSNDANYRNPAYDALYEQSSVMLPSAERTALYRRMNQMVIDDCVAMTGISRTRVYLWHRNVIAVPDREIVGGYFLRYVDLADAGGRG
jgi:ABC-type transport system substrate-binding protein